MPGARPPFVRLFRRRAADAMPEDPLDSRLSLRQQAAIAAVGAELSLLPEGVLPLSEHDLRTYELRHAKAGWRLEVQFLDRRRRLDLLLIDGFPRRPPRVALVDRPPFLTWPHVEEDGC